MAPRMLTALLAILTAIGCLGAGGNGCTPEPPDRSALEGLWSIARGELDVKFTFTVAGGGEVQQSSSTGQLEPLNPEDFPEVLAGLIEQWNAGLLELNDALDAALPDQVAVTFPQLATMQMWDPAEPGTVATGLINDVDEYVFIGDLSGDGDGSEQGGGAILQLSSVEGAFDKANLTTTGLVARRLGAVLFGSGGAIAFSVELRMHYTGERIGELP